MNDGIYTVAEFIDSKSTLLAKIQSIDVLISKFESKLTEVGDSIAYDEYQLDDGQMKVRTKYRSVKDVMAGINALEQLKQRYQNRYNGRRVVFRGGNF